MVFAVFQVKKNLGYQVPLTTGERNQSFGGECTWFGISKIFLMTRPGACN